jgi:UDP-N-acetylglucosamine 1-carboxyvinyltransferase
MGASISGIGSNLLTIDGVQRLHSASIDIGPDYMEIGSFIGLAAATKGELTITGTNPDDLHMVKLGYRRLGICWEQRGADIFVPRAQRRSIIPDLSSMVPKIEDAPWPGFPADLLSIITVAATQMRGTLLVHEKMFESRMYFVDMLIRMGAQIILCDPHRAIVTGPSPLKGSLLTSPDVRAGMALVIAALAADGESEIQNVYQIERGYENLCKKLAEIGADIRRVE